MLFFVVLNIRYCLIVLILEWKKTKLWPYKTYPLYSSRSQGHNTKGSYTLYIPSVKHINWKKNWSADPHKLQISTFLQFMLDSFTKKDACLRIVSEPKKIGQQIVTFDKVTFTNDYVHPKLALQTTLTTTYLLLWTWPRTSFAVGWVFSSSLAQTFLASWSTTSCSCQPFAGVHWPFCEVYAKIR